MLAHDFQVFAWYDGILTVRHLRQAQKEYIDCNRRDRVHQPLPIDAPEWQKTQARKDRDY
jgi:hypothetical protein